MLQCHSNALCSNVCFSEWSNPHQHLLSERTHWSHHIPPTGWGSRGRALGEVAVSLISKKETRGLTGNGFSELSCVTERVAGSSDASASAPEEPGKAPKNSNPKFIFNAMGPLTIFHLRWGHKLKLIGEDKVGMNPFPIRVEIIAHLLYYIYNSTWEGVQPNVSVA